MTEWPARIKGLRNKLGTKDRPLTQRQLAERLGMDVLSGVVLISRWENGVCPPDRRYQIALAELEREA